MKVTAALIREIKKDPVGVLRKMPTEDVVDIIQEANYRYYTKGSPMFTDTLFDVIKEILRERDANHPILFHVGAVVERENKVRLPYWMGSLDKIKSSDKDVTKWMQTHRGQVVISDKLDGNSAMFSWDVSKKVGMLFTRGNGAEGQDISHLVPFVQHLPRPKESMVVRGELIMSKAAFATVSSQGKNARNMVAGLLNAKKPDLALLANVEFVAYEMLCCTPRGTVLSEQMRNMARHGFKVVHHMSRSSDKTDVSFLSSVLQERRGSSAYEVDGIVVCHDAPNNLATQGNPSYAFAFKSVAFMDRAEVVVTSVEWNLSHHGYYKPVVVFDGVELAGVTVRRATGHNAKFIKDNEIGAGARIVVIRSGDVIPYIAEVLEGAEVVSLPSGNGVKWTNSGVDLMWSNSTTYNPELAFKTIAYFFDKVDVRGMSSGTLRKLFNSGYDTISKLWNIDRASLLAIDGIKDKMADNLVREIRAMRDRVDVVTLMSASNSFGRGIGVRILTSIIKVCPEVVKGNPPPIPSLLAISGIENKTATKIVEGTVTWKQFAIDNDLGPYIDRYFKSAKAPRSNASTGTNTTSTPNGAKTKREDFSGKSIVFTGIRDKALEERVVGAGGDVKTSVSKKTSLVVYAPNKPISGKLKDAEKHGVPTMSIDEFRALIGNM
jgi:DNA ligase (NAD+)